MDANPNDAMLNAVRDRLEAFTQRLALDVHYERYPEARPSLAEIAIAAAQLDDSPLAHELELLHRAPTRSCESSLTLTLTTCRSTRLPCGRHRPPTTRRHRQPPPRERTAEGDGPWTRFWDRGGFRRAMLLAAVYYPLYIGAGYLLGRIGGVEPGP